MSEANASDARAKLTECIEALDVGDLRSAAELCQSAASKLRTAAVFAYVDRFERRGQSGPAAQKVETTCSPTWALAGLSQQELIERFAPNRRREREDARADTVDQLMRVLGYRDRRDPADPGTIEVRILVRVDEHEGCTYYNAAGWNDPGEDVDHATDDVLRDQIEEFTANAGCWTESPQWSVVTARVPKPKPIAEVEGAVEADYSA